MISLTRKDYDKNFIQKGYEEFTEDQFRKWIDMNNEILIKGEQGDLEDDLEKAEYEGFKEEIRSFTAVEVVEPSPISQFRIQKSIMYVRPKQVEWDEPELIKGENGEEIQKARSGKYKDTPLNRKLGRVGNPYGGKKGADEKKEESEKGEFKIGKKYDTDSNMGGKLSYKFTGEKDGKLQFKNTMHKDYGGGTTLSLTKEQAEEKFSQFSSSKEGGEEKKGSKNQESKGTFKEGDRVDSTYHGTGTLISVEGEEGTWMKTDSGSTVAVQLENIKKLPSKSQPEDKGKSEKKQSETKRSIKELEDLHPSKMTFKEFERLHSSKNEYGGSDMERSVLEKLYDKKSKEDLVKERTEKQIKEVKEGKRKKEDVDLPF